MLIRAISLPPGFGGPTVRSEDINRLKAFSPTINTAEAVGIFRHHATTPLRRGSHKIRQNRTLCRFEKWRRRTGCRRLVPSIKRLGKHAALLLASIHLAAVAGSPQSLKDGFGHPPDSSRPWVNWFWL